MESGHINRPVQVRALSARAIQQGMAQANRLDLEAALRRDCRAGRDIEALRHLLRSQKDGGQAVATMDIRLPDQPGLIEDRAGKIECGAGNPSTIQPQRIDAFPEITHGGEHTRPPSRCLRFADLSRKMAHRHIHGPHDLGGGGRRAAATRRTAVEQGDAPPAIRQPLSDERADDSRSDDGDVDRLGWKWIRRPRWPVRFLPGNIPGAQVAAFGECHRAIGSSTAAPIANSLIRDNSAG